MVVMEAVVLRGLTILRAMERWSNRRAPSQRNEEREGGEVRCVEGDGTRTGRYNCERSPLRS